MWHFVFIFLSLNILVFSIYGCTRNNSAELETKNHFLFEQINSPRFACPQSVRCAKLKYWRNYVIHCKSLWKINTLTAICILYRASYTYNNISGPISNTWKYSVNLSVYHFLPISLDDGPHSTPHKITSIQFLFIASRISRFSYEHIYIYRYKV